MQRLKLAFFSLGAAFLLSVSASANTFYVSTSGADGNPGSQALPWRTIRHAVNAGDTIVVKPCMRAMRTED